MYACFISLHYLRVLNQEFQQYDVVSMIFAFLIFPRHPCETFMTFVLDCHPIGHELIYYEVIAFLLHHDV